MLTCIYYFTVGLFPSFLSHIIYMYVSLHVIVCFPVCTQVIGIHVSTNRRPFILYMYWSFYCTLTTLVFSSPIIYVSIHGIVCFPVCTQVIGIPDERMGEELCAWVKLKDGCSLSEEEFKTFAKGQVRWSHQTLCPGSIITCTIDWRIVIFNTAETHPYV